jgi:hypothetical protein
MDTIHINPQLTLREIVDEQNQAFALHMLQKAVLEDYIDHVCLFKTTE